MYAVIESGGKQYRVEKGDVIEVELAPTTGKKVKRVEFGRVLMVSDKGGVQVGNPTVSGASVSGVLESETRGPKVKVFKRKRRKGYRRTQGHRQDLLRVRIDRIKV